MYGFCGQLDNNGVKLMEILLDKSFLFQTLGILFASLLTATVHGQQNLNDGPMVQEKTTTKISTHVYVIPDNSVPGVPNVGIVVGDKATLIIDTGLGYKNGLIVYEEAKKVSGENQLYLVTTHIHPEHDLGAHAFPDSTQMIRSNDQINEIKENGLRTADVFRNRSTVMNDLLEGAKFRDADIEFEKEYTLDLGGVEVQLLALGPNHTPGDTATFVEKDKVLFSGDVAMKALPAFASPKSSLAHWLASLDRLESLQAKTIVPSHGPMGDVELITEYRRYFTLVKNRVQALKSEGLTLEQITAKLSGELQEQFSSSRRIAGAIRTAFAESK